MIDLKEKLELLLAKSKPRETVREHTDNLLSQARLLKSMGYIKNENLFEDLLLSCEYHDYGKINDKFQERIKSGKRITEDEVPHNVLSVYFIDKDKCNEYANVFFSVLYHHFHKQSPLDYIDLNPDIVKEEVEKIFGEDDTEEIIDKCENILFDIGDMFEKKIEDKKDLILLKGFLHKCDYSASAGIDCEIENDFLNETIKEWEINTLQKNGKELNNLQKFCFENSNKNIIVTAPTGMGKTEAGLIWCGNNKCFFVLPLRTAINAMYERFKKLTGENYKERVALLHSDMKTYYFYNNSNTDEQGIDIDYINRSKQLSMPLTVCTPDQLFNFVLKYPGYEHKLATASYSKFIIDEIQMYTPELLSAVIYGISLIKEMGGKIAVLTATLPPFVKYELKKVLGDEFVEMDFSQYGIKRHNMKVLQQAMTAENIIKSIDNIKSDNIKKFLVVCNSIDIANDIYQKINEYYKNYFKVNLFHAHFTKEDRNKKEKDILSSSNDRINTEIWVSTSVVEASLDIDFDILFTEMSDLFSLFQRFGRVNRKGEKSIEKTNCYVYTELQGNAKRYSFFDEDIHNLSKQAILSVENGIIDEKQKKNLIDEYLSVERVRKTNYLSKYKETFGKYIKLYEYTEKDLSKLRNIFSYDVIPESVYNENKEYIEKQKAVLSRKYDLDEQKKIGMTEEQIKKKISEEKIKAKNETDKFTVSVSKYRFENYLDFSLSDTNFGIFVISNCEYDSEKGLIFNKLQKKEKGKADDDCCEFIL